MKNLIKMIVPCAILLLAGCSSIQMPKFPDIPFFGSGAEPLAEGELAPISTNDVKEIAKKRPGLPRDTQNAQHTEEDLKADEPPNY